MPAPTDADDKTSSRTNTSPETQYRNRKHHSEGARSVPNLTAENFDRWWAERKFAENIRTGKPYFNGPSPIPEPERHNPSQLLKCKRKTYYTQENAPAETPDPRGIFWFGSRFEEDVIVPYLADEVARDGQYVTNSLWVDFTTDTRVGDLRIKGATDPVIVDAKNEPIVLTEIKTKQNIDNLQQPDRQHRGQAHAYMAGLTKKYDTTVTTAVIIYASRTSFDLKPFHIQFDNSFWNDTVIEWATQHTSHRLNKELPPANPEYDWECQYCSYRERCGKGEREFSDVGATGLLPLTEYPREQLTEYLTAWENAWLTPTLANQYPDLAKEFSVYDWSCSGCSNTYKWDSSSLKRTSYHPRCPACEDNDRIRILSGPPATDQYPTKEAMR